MRFGSRVPRIRQAPGSRIPRKMMALRDNLLSKRVPLVTYTLIALNAIIYLWDRQFAILGQSLVFADLSMVPSNVVAAFKGGDTFSLVTVFTSMFLHGNLVHVLGNMVYLIAFGGAIEAALGAPRFALYYLFWGIVASAAQILVNPTSDIPVVGASGAIGGVLGAFFLLFPTAKIELIIPWVFIPIEVSAWILLGLWFLWQIFIPQAGVANWAHAGGFLAGMVTVLILGGREAILKGREDEILYDE